MPIFRIFCALVLIPGVVVLAAPTAAAATTYNLTVTKTAGGSVSSSPAGISCGFNCSQPYVAGTVVTLTATPTSGKSFAGWTGACSGTQPSCSVTLNAAKSVNAAFATTYKLTVTKSGGGSVVSSPAGISCGSDCVENYALNQVVTLTAQPNAGDKFTAWNGACTGQQLTCSVTMNAVKSVGATFALAQNYQLSVTKSGSGAVTSAPPGINCGTDCTENYASGTNVTLTAAPGPDTSLTWSGACAGTSTCTVTMNAAKSVTATFTSKYPLTVATVGPGSVTSAPPGINCGTDCTETFTGGTNVTLTATPNQGAIFKQWTGDCTGPTTTCTVGMSAAKNISAIFESSGEFALTAEVNRFYGGDGTITSNPPGIDCATDCTETYPAGTMVTLTATPRADSYFHDWGYGQGCADVYGTTCTVTVDQAKTVSAHFGLIHVLKVNKTGTGGGTITSNPAGIDCGTVCTRGYDDEDWHLNESWVELTATPDAGSYFVGWSGRCSGTGTCAFSMDGSRGAQNPTNVTAAFDRIPENSVILNVVIDAEVWCWEACNYYAAGIVTSEPAGIDCGTRSGAPQSGTCRLFVTAGTEMTLTGTPEYADYYRFKGWSGGGCTGTGPCQLTINENTTVTAAFGFTDWSWYWGVG